ncbi:hypothetical protein EXS54_00855 [Patescibacteria group bacterium]|nr:hypothetical protein [Patescibacteria group bacterium]
MNPEIVLGFFGLVIIAVGTMLAIDRHRRRVRFIPAEEKAYAHVRWHEVEKMVQKGGPSNLQQAVVEGDKLVDHCLKHLGIPGDSMGERLRNSKDRFTDYDGLWKAHKVRNQVVHESRKELLSFETKQAIGRFKQALTDLGVL